jgi:hypothetical protein
MSVRFSGIRLSDLDPNRMSQVNARGIKALLVWTSAKVT